MSEFLAFRRYLKGKSALFFWGLLAGIIFAAASGFGVPFFIKVVFAEVFESERGQYTALEIFLIAAQLPGIFLLRGLSGYFNQFFMSNCALHILKRVREALFSKIQDLPLAYHDKQKSGDLLSRILSDTTLLQDTLQRSAEDLIRAPLQVVISFVALVVISMMYDEVVFIYLVFLTAPVAMIPVFLIGKRLKKWGTLMQESQAEMTNLLSENLDSTSEIRTYNLQSSQIGKFNEQLKHLFHKQMKTIKYQIASQPLVETVTALLISATFVICYLKGVELSTFLAMGGVLFMTYDPLKRIFRLYGNIQKTQGAIHRINAILEENDSTTDPEDPLPFDDCQGEITFSDVTFAYDEAPVLKSATVNIPKGSSVALVGPSGAGKSTFAKLIPRLYEISSGLVKIDGTSIRDVTKKSLRDKIAVVSQHPVLFNDTLFNNIHLGRPDATEQEVYEAARNAFADEFIREMDKGYNTLAGERGERLSGGQRQRIAIARAFLRNAPILILDEATSALDAQSEEAIQNALSKLVKGKTVIIIAHRFSTIRLADSIFVFENGHITATGSHDELYNRNSLYTQLYNKQM